MTIEQLKYIVAIARSGSLKAAAAEQHVTLPALSQALTNLERELNISLFRRSRTGTTPTEEGSKLIQHAEAVLEKLQEFTEEAETYTESLNGELKIASFPGPMEILVELFSNFRKLHPNIKASLFEHTSQRIMRKVEAEAVDIGLVIYTEKEVQKYRNLVFKKLLDGHMVTAVNNQHPLAKEELVTEEMLLKQPIVLYNDAYIQAFMRQFKSLQYDILFTTNNVQTIRNMVENETAINIGFDYAFRTDAELSRSKDITLLHFAPPFFQTYSFGYVYHGNNTLSRVARTFLRELEETILAKEELHANSDPSLYTHIKNTPVI
ncbi:LysR family transcriptional regulator [Terribacillus saccharophilus]|uniref:HTH lysR-type domain-containing protein n=1 Tax=Terribacillus saccharophilus TaxID=361277 RepID=A0A268AE11_9BACI|nr:LysR family transcriptional regulator [Terribacillus saccharophilus]PAD22360.1 hypothetical protein CHH64_01210 [Terribacillus saccharophilus]PAF18699.1 hypothetical protein CHH51_05215 [Terribacillus saccharophilus]